VYQVLFWCFRRSLISQYGNILGLDPNRVPANNAVDQAAEALAKGWSEYNNPRSVWRKKIPFHFHLWFSEYLIKHG